MKLGWKIGFTYRGERVYVFFPYEELIRIDEILRCIAEQGDDLK